MGGALSIQFYQLTEIRRMAAALLCAIREDDPDAGLTELIEVVLCTWITDQGGEPPQTPRARKRRSTLGNALETLGQDEVTSPDDLRTSDLWVETLKMPGSGPEALGIKRRVDHVWRRAVELLYRRVFNASTDEDLGPLIVDGPLIISDGTIGLPNHGTWRSFGPGGMLWRMVA